MATRCFMGAFPLERVGDAPADAVLFGAPHGTPYPGIDNAPHAGSMQALREALASDADWVDHWSYDVGGPIMGTSGFRLGDLGDLPTAPHPVAGAAAQFRPLAAAVPLAPPTVPAR